MDTLRYKNHLLFSLLALVLLLSGCAHEVRIAPDVSQIDRPFGSPNRLENSVAYYISQEQIAKSVVTAAGGGDSVKYSPYKDFIEGFEKVLKNTYEKVVRLSSLTQIDKNIDLVFLPKVSTSSSSSSSIFWPPENFSIELETSIRKPNGEILNEIKVSGSGSAVMGTLGSGEHSSGRSIAGERAMLDALQKIQNKLLNDSFASANKNEVTISSGSGFFVTPNLVITNQHVINKCTQITVRMGLQSSLAKVHHQTKKSDLALLHVEFSNPIVGKLRSSPILGEEIMVAGHPLTGILSSSLIVSSGNVNSLAGAGDDSTLMQISAPVQSGNSGGPILDKSGNIVGVTSSKLKVEKIFQLTGDSPQNVNFGIKPEIVRLFLENSGIRFESGSLRNELPNQEVAKVAQAITVQVQCNK